MDIFILSVEFFNKVKIHHRLIKCLHAMAGIAPTAVHAFMSGQRRWCSMEYQPGQTAGEEFNASLGDDAGK